MWIYDHVRYIFRIMIPKFHVSLISMFVRLLGDIGKRHCCVVNAMYNTLFSILISHVRSSYAYAVFHERLDEKKNNNIGNNPAKCWKSV